MKQQLAIFMAAALLLTLPACESSGNTSGAASVTASKTVTIGVLEPKTGTYGSAGLREALGITYAQSLRPTVTVDGTIYRVVLDWQDSQSDEIAAATAAQKLVTDRCAAVIGSCDAESARAAGPIFSDAQIPAITPSCTDASVTYGNDTYFRACCSDAFQGTILADWASGEGYQTAATVNHLDNPYTASLVAAFTTQFEKNGGKVVDAETFADNTSDFTNLLTNLKKSRSKIVFAPTDLRYAPLLLNQAATLGLTVQWVAGDAWNEPTLLTEAGANAEGVMVSSCCAQGVDKTFDTNFQSWLTSDSNRLSDNGGTTDLASGQILAYDCYNLLLDAIEQANTLEGSAIRDTLSAMKKTDAVGGPLQFDQDGNAIRTNACVLTVRKGAFTLLKPIVQQK